MTSKPIALLPLVLVLGGAGAASAQSTDVSGTLTYHVEHRLKAFDAVFEASGADVKLVLDPGDLEQLRFGIRIPLGGFDSGNTLRDEHAAEALETFLFPEALWRVEEVTVVSDDAGPPRRAQLRVSGPLEVHGVTVPLTADVDLILEADRALARSEFELSLEALGIVRPGLLGMKIADKVSVTVDLVAPFTPAAEVTP